MKFIVFLTIAGVAAMMAFMAWRGECSGGAVVVSEEQCRLSRSFTAEICSKIFSATDEAVRNAATVYPNEADCMRDFEKCVRSAHTQGYTPVPSAFCVSRVPGKSTAPEPIYRRINAAQVGNRP